MAYSTAVKSSLYLRLLRNNHRLVIPNERTINYVRYKVRQKSREINLAKVSPVFVTYFVTNRCNLSCSFCMVGNVLNPKDWRDREATVDKTARLFEQPIAKRALHVMLSGGEPTINQEIAPIIKLLKQRTPYSYQSVQSYLAAYAGSDGGDRGGRGTDAVSRIVRPLPRERLSIFQRFRTT